MNNNTNGTRYDFRADVALTYDDVLGWCVVTGPLHPYGVDSVSYPSRAAALRAYRATVQEVTDNE